MKAIVYREYGSPDILKLEEVEKPSLKDDEVLINVQAASVNPLDWHYMRGEPFLVRLSMGLLRPKNTRLGVDVAGQVEAVGKNVTQFQPGDEVFGTSYLGSLGEYVCATENTLVSRPANLTFEELAAVPVAAITALQGLRDQGKIQPGQKVLINGASGGVGTFAVQIAKSFGAEVTAVCSTGNMDSARSIGAEHVIDYTKEDFTKNGKRYDLIIGANGHRSLSDYKRALSLNGTYVCTGGTMAQIFESILLGPLMSTKGGKKISNMGIAQSNQKDLVLIKDLLETGKVVPVIDRCYPLGETAEAIRYLEAGHAKGKVVVTI
jgi:NADPH:quinone reductase-like Zn-dependent oxidoreductase